MPAETPFLVFISILLVLGSAFFVAAEYSLVSSRRSRLETIAKGGNRTASSLVKALDNLSSLVACIQIGITMLGIGVGAVTEPFVTRLLSELVGHRVDPRLSFVLAFLIVTFGLVVVGELVPKYATLRNPERTALLLYPPLRWISVVFYPLTWLAKVTALGLLRGLGVRPPDTDSAAVPKEELLLLVQTGGADGILEKKHAELVSRALRLDVLTARDIMIHRLDVKWLPLDTPRDELLQRLKTIPYTRIPVCREDIDSVAGLVFVHDIVRRLDQPELKLEQIMCPAVFVPENLPMGRIVDTMRTEKTHLLVVMDEYGGTSGIITIEDVVEEVFGDLEDRTEVQRPPIEVRGSRISAKAEVRYDELIAFLDLPLDPGEVTDTLATMIAEGLENVPKTGDMVETNLGTLRVENMARNRITRVTLGLAPEWRDVLAARAAEK
ncbi:MAG TPA: hemolysin family protein [Fimbriimonadaceae bacterium]|nr:hemolysin family protein [Fimbriimonadaceae bacterium]